MKRFSRWCAWGLALLPLAAAAGPLPYAVRPLPETAPRFALTRAGEPFGEAALGWSPAALTVAATVRDDTPVTLADIGGNPGEGYRADSLEFWVNRHQFGLMPAAGGFLVYDYLYQQPVAGARGTWQRDAHGYTLHAELPWAALGVPGEAFASFAFALQVNDAKPAPAGERWKDSVRQTLLPEGAVWDRPATYALVFLHPGGTGFAGAPTPVQVAGVELRSFAYEKRTECRLQRTPAFAAADLRLHVLAPDGSVFRDLAVPAGPGRQLLDLPWDESRAGLFTAALYLADGDRRFGPLAEAYFNAGPVPIAQYRSPRQPPADLAAFWSARIEAMRARAFAAEPLPCPSPKADTEVRKLRLLNHRGNPMLVYLSRKKADQGRLPVELNVYPPMAADAPKPARPGWITLTFCGSLQGEARRPGQTANETLWARAESLDDCYWLDVVLDGVRALDYAASLPDSNGKAMVTGGSRGGWYSFALGAVAPDRVALARFTSPCYSDATMNRRLGHGSAAAEVYSVFARDEVRTGGRIFANFQYFDPLFLATLVRTRMCFSAGLQDEICSAVGMTAAAHAITAPETLFVLDPEGGHGGYPGIGQFYPWAEAGLR